MKTIFRFSIVSVFLFLPVLILAQTNPSADLPQFLFTAFSKGDVLMKNGDTYSHLFNYNTVDEEMIFSQNGKYMVPEKPEDIDTIYLNNCVFVPVERAFYEVIVKRPLVFFIQHKSKYSSVGSATAYGLTSQVNAPTTVNTIKAGHQIRTLDMPDNVKVTPDMVYWVKVDDKMRRFISERQLLKIFPEYEVELKDFIKKNNIDIDSKTGLVVLGNFCNELKKKP